MHLLRNDTVNICTLSNDDGNDLVHKIERPLKTMNSLSTKAYYLSDAASCKKRKISDSIFLTSSSILNKIQRIDSFNPQSKSRKCVQFDLSATTIHNLGRTCFSFKSRRGLICVTIGEQLIQRNETSVSIEQDATLRSNDYQMKESMWYSPLELRQIRLKAYYTSKRVQLNSELTDTYNKCLETNYEHRNSDNILLKRLSDTHKTHQNSALTSKPYTKKLDEFIWQRGLERWSSPGFEFHRITYLVLWKTSFFLEQSDQMISGKKDPIKLANICRSATVASTNFALLLASIDAYDVK